MFRLAAVALLLLTAACSITNVNVFKEGGLPSDFLAHPAGLRIEIPEHQSSVSAATYDAVTKELGKAGIRYVEIDKPHKYLVTIYQQQADPEDRLKPTAFVSGFSPSLTSGAPNIVFLSKGYLSKRIQKTTIRLAVSRYDNPDRQVEMYYRVAVYEGGCGSLKEVISPLYRALFSGFPDGAGRATVLLSESCDKG